MCDMTLEPRRAEDTLNEWLVEKRVDAFITIIIIAVFAGVKHGELCCHPLLQSCWAPLPQNNVQLIQFRVVSCGENRRGGFRFESSSYLQARGARSEGQITSNLYWNVADEGADPCNGWSLIRPRVVPSQRWLLNDFAKEEARENCLAVFVLPYLYTQRPTHLMSNWRGYSVIIYCKTLTKQKRKATDPSAAESFIGWCWNAEEF